MFNLFGKKAMDYFSAEEKERIKIAIQEVEKTTSGEVRVYVEHFCRSENPMKRATEIFHSLKMDQTTHHNSTLIYVAIRHKKLAIYGDSGIHEKVGDEFWAKLLKTMQEEFRHKRFAVGIENAIREIGSELARYFPFDASTNKNELPDDMVFGR